MNKFESYKEEFKDRHNGPTKNEQNQMLKEIGLSSLDGLVGETVPQNIRLNQQIDIDAAPGEQRLLEEIKQKAAKNKVFKTYIGLGYYDTHTPNVILRNVLENPGWYTAYTPYQAEISQGRLNALLNYQTMVTDLTGLEIANASLLDEATAAAEAMLMFHTNQKKNGNKFFVSKKVFPQTIEVLKTRAYPKGIELVIDDHRNVELNSDYFGALVQYPDEQGQIHNYKKFVENAKEHNVLIGVAADLLSLAVLTPPGEWGADCVVGSAQRFGIPLGYGGPHAAYFATKDQFKRKVPGRMIGLSIDSLGNNASRMALQTREQHIRREKATSNVCTAQVLLANIAGFYAVYHGPEGIRNHAKRIHLMAKSLENALHQIGYNQTNTTYFDTLKVDLGDESSDLLNQIKEKALAKGINLRYFDNPAIGIAFDETKNPRDLQELIDIFSEVKRYEGQIDAYQLIEETDESIPEEFARQSDYLTHQVFNSYHSETKMLRYLKQLENKDLSLAHSMIPLGSCTMKLNATTEMIPITWPEFAKIHPFTPKDQVQGYHEIIDALSDQLEEITGFAAISNQPNAGAQGEYTGLMVIREHLKDRGEDQRNIALIPSSAHGTNPASAVMAGMKVVVINCDEDGNIDLNDLKQKATDHKDTLAALMITYPSTHGVFEEDIKEICKTIHDNGGQVYLDGANLNAQLGLTTPAMVGADVCHLNLHKTFTIPHGGGGPGMGPIAVADHLADYLPSHIFSDSVGGNKAMSAVASAPYGSSSILLISYIFNYLMGGEGLTEASKLAILNTNYIKNRLENYFKPLYLGKKGRTAHEYIVDTRDFKKDGIEVEDIAKRLMDYGFHAPTMSFPVPGTLMIEPTESEAKDELDRFCDAMINIRKEIDEVANGEADPEDNVLKNAPHTKEMVIADNWNHNYSREKAAYPLSWLKEVKFWAPVGRVDSSYGDRNLMCSCPPMDEYMEEEAVSN